MHMLTLPELREYIAHAPAIPKHKDRSEVRVYATVITGATLWSMLQPAFYVVAGVNSPLHTVASVGGHRWLIAGLFLAICIALLPHLLSLVFFPQYLGHKLPRKMAAGAMVAAGVTWGLLATLAEPLDLGFVPWGYWISAAGYMLVGGAFGYSLNAQLAQEKEKTEIVNESQPEIS